MNEVNDIYRPLVQSLLGKYGDRLKTMVLFGSQAHHEAKLNSDHDVFVVVESLPSDPVVRQREVRSVLLSILNDLPGAISFTAKTPEEVKARLTPLLLDI